MTKDQWQKLAFWVVWTAVGLAGLGWLAVAVNKDELERMRVQAEWSKYLHEHCHVVAVSAGGWGHDDIVAWRCDNGRDYIARGTE